MSTTPGNPIASAVGENQFSDMAQFGQVEQQAQLTQEAPISGAPMPVQPQGQSAPTQPAPAAAAPPAAPAPTVQPAYYAQLAETWGALASIHGASPRVKEMAKQAKADSKRRA